MTFGLTDEGFTLKRLQDILDELKTRQQSEFGANVEVGPDSVLGQLSGIYAEREASVWELAQTVHNAGRFLGATGTDLDAVGALVGIVRAPAVATTFVGTLTGTPATFVAAGSIVLLDGTDRRFTLVADATIGGGGTVDADFECTVTGPIEVLSGSTWIIETPVTGWTSVSNALDADPGSDLQTDREYRDTILNSFAGIGNSAAAIRAAILRLAGVEEVRVYENDSPITDSEGRPAHSFEAVSRGGDGQEIADAIFANKPAGIRSYGSDPYTVTDSEGDPHTIEHTPATEIDIWIEVDIIGSVGVYPDDGDALVTEELLNLEDTLRIGTDVYEWSLRRLVETEGILSLEIRIGTAPNPATSDPIVIGAREIAALDSSRIAITSTLVE